MLMAQRPTGVTLICVLGFIQALMMIGSGLYVFYFGSVLSGAGAGAGSIGMAFGILGMIFSAMALIPVFIGLLLLVAFYWLWNMKRSGWTIVVILQILALLFSLAGTAMMDPASIINLVLSGAILYYLFTNKKLFK